MKSHNKRKSGLLYEKVLKKQPVFQPPRIEPPQKKILKPNSPKIVIPTYKELQPMPKFMDPINPISPGALKTAEQLDRNAERNRIKYENQNRRRLMEEERQKMLNDFKQQMENMSQRPVLIPVEEGDSGINMIKRNSAAPFKLPHQSKTALHNNGFIASGGELTDDERAKATELLDSTMNTYMNRDYKRKGRFDPETRKVVFENVPMTEEENLAEWNREKGEYYVDFDNEGKAKVLNIPRGDDDIPVQSFIKSLDPSQYRGTIPTDDQLPEDYYDPGLDPNSVLNPFKGYQRIKNYRQR